MNPWILALRPKTLTATWAPIFACACMCSRLAGREGQHMSWALALWALASTFCIQIATNLFNDALDAKKGTDTSARLGPLRATASGLLSYSSVMRGALLFAVAAVFFAVPLIARGGWPILALGMVSLLFAYGYTGGPLPLAYNGLGEVFVILFFGFAAVTGLSFVLLGKIPVQAWVMGFQMGALGANLVSINNLRDVSEDRRNQKRTLVVLLGPKFVTRLMLALTLSSFFLVPYWKHLGDWAGVLPFATLPLVIRLFRNLKENSPSPLYNRFLAQSAALQFLFACLLGAGILWG